MQRGEVTFTDHTMLIITYGKNRQQKARIIGCFQGSFKRRGSVVVTVVAGIVLALKPHRITAPLYGNAASNKPNLSSRGASPRRPVVAEGEQLK